MEEKYEIRPNDDEHVSLRTPFPMVRLQHRELGPFFKGPVYVWDVDKTYLDTRFSELKHLVRIPMELAVDKSAVPGTVELLHALRQGTPEHLRPPLHFISASPPQMKTVIEKKMLLDGVEFDGIFYKNQWALVRRGCFGEIRNHVAFKLSALLLLYSELPESAVVHLFGDDMESDPLIYSLFADVTAGRLRGPALQETLEQVGVPRRRATLVEKFTRELPAREVVSFLFIHLVRCPDGQSIRLFDDRVVGWPSPTAAARVLADNGMIQSSAVDTIASASGDSQPIRGSRPVVPGRLRTPKSLIQHNR